MMRSLLLRVLLPVGLLLCAGLVLVIREQLHITHLQEQLALHSRQREDFDRALLRLLDRHQRDLSRVRRLAQTDTSDSSSAANNRKLATIALISQQYAVESTRHLQNADQILSATIETSIGKQHFEFNRLKTELVRIQKRSEEVVAGVDLVLEARASLPLAALATLLNIPRETPSPDSKPIGPASTDTTHADNEANPQNSPPKPTNEDATTTFDDRDAKADPREGKTSEVNSKQKDRSPRSDSLGPNPTETGIPTTHANAIQLGSALIQLDKRDAELRSSTRLALGMSRRIYLRTQRQLLSGENHPQLWLVWLGTWPVLLLFSALPLIRIRKLANDEHSTGRTLSREEAALSSAFAHLKETNLTLTGSAQTSAQQVDKHDSRARRAEHELALLRIYNENLVNSLRAAIVVTDTRGKLTATNRTARHLLGLSDADRGRSIDTMPLYQAIAQNLQDLSGDLQRALQGTPLRVAGISLGDIHKKEASASPERRIDLSIIPYRDEGGAPRGLLWVADDVTDATKMRDQLIAAEHLATVGRLSSQIAHEIRNPLSAIGLNAELLDEELGSGQGLSREKCAEAQGLLRAIGSEIERLSQVTESYLQLARMPRPQCRSTDLNQVVTDLLTMLDPELKARHIEVRLQFASPAPRTWVDPGQIRQALLNIVRNSSDAMQDGGVLTFKTENTERGGRLSVEDTGIGIAKEERARIFEPFYSTKPDGTGLGLSLTHQIIKEHAGRIEVACPKSSGTIVMIDLPADMQGQA